MVLGGRIDHANPCGASTTRLRIPVAVPALVAATQVHNAGEPPAPGVLPPLGGDEFAPGPPGHPAKDRCPGGRVSGGQSAEIPRVEIPVPFKIPHFHNLQVATGNQRPATGKCTPKDHAAWQPAHHPAKYSRAGERALHSARGHWRNRTPLSRHGGSFRHTTSRITSGNSRRFHRNAGPGQMAVVNLKRKRENSSKTSESARCDTSEHQVPHGTWCALRALFDSRKPSTGVPV